MLHITKFTVRRSIASL